MKHARAAALVAALWLGAPAAAQTATCAAEAGALVRTVSTSIARYADARGAVLDGYRPISHDFPGMGEHWINLRYAVRDEFDPEQPPVLLYARRDSAHVLVGAAFVALRDPGEPMPGPTWLRGAWHEHSGTLDDELFAGDHRTRHDQGRFGVMVLHVWSAPSPGGGPFDVQNWTLPWLRAGLAVPDESAGGDAARALSLGTSGAYYRDVLVRAGVPALDGAELDALLHASAVEALAVAPDASRLAAVWTTLAERIGRRWPDARAAMQRLGADPHVELACGH